MSDNYLRLSDMAFLCHNKMDKKYDGAGLNFQKNKSIYNKTGTGRLYWNKLII